LRARGGCGEVLRSATSLFKPDPTRPQCTIPRKAYSPFLARRSCPPALLHPPRRTRQRLIRRRRRRPTPRCRVRLHQACLRTCRASSTRTSAQHICTRLFDVRRPPVCYPRTVNFGGWVRAREAAPRARTATAGQGQCLCMVVAWAYGTGRSARALERKGERKRMCVLAVRGR
jgi:hypothetical protein